MRTDAELKRQLDDAAGTDEQVEAVLVLKPTRREQTVPDSTDTNRLADAAIQRVTNDVGTAPTAVNVLENVGMVVVCAVEPFVRKLLEQPEFASAIANSDSPD
jgi:hypothetical protein